MIASYSGLLSVRSNIVALSNIFFVNAVISVTSAIGLPYWGHNKRNTLYFTLESISLLNINYY